MTRPGGGGEIVRTRRAPEPPLHVEGGKITSGKTRSWNEAMRKCSDFLLYKEGSLLQATLSSVPAGWGSGHFPAPPPSLPCAASWAWAEGRGEAKGCP